jgi:Uma2 family endonuclease
MTAPTAVTSSTTPRLLEPGTTGWTVNDLRDGDIATQWEQGRFEIIEGVLTSMPAAYLYGNRRLMRLIDMIKAHLGPDPACGEFATEVDVALAEDRVVRADAVFMTPEDDRRQDEELKRRGGFEDEVAPVFVPPTLIIESISRGHERHDRVLKQRWYGEAKVPNYWLFNTYQRTLDCLVLDGSVYRVDQSGRGDEEVRPSLFPGLVIPLLPLWNR